MRSENIYYIYLFHSYQHFKRICYFLNSKDDSNKKLLILFFKKFSCLEQIKSNIEFLDNSNLEIEFIEFSKIKLLNNLKKRFAEDKFNLLIDKHLSELQFKLCGSLYKNNSSKIIFIEHNLHFHWGYFFNHKDGYRKNNILYLLLSRNFYQLLLISLFSNLKVRTLKRKINIFDLMNFGIASFADEICIYDSNSYKYFQRTQSISKIEKSIIRYQFDFIPSKPKNLNVYNICIFTVGTFKAENHKLSKRKINILKFIVSYLGKKYSNLNYKLTIKLKKGEIEKVPYIYTEFKKDIRIVDNIDNLRNSFHHVVVPIDSFALIEYLRSDVKVYTYNIFKNYGPISQFASKVHQIKIDF